MKKSVRFFFQTILILTMLGTGIQVSAQPSVITEVPVNSTGFITVGDLVYFTSDFTSGQQLWRTDGTGDGTFFLGGFNQLRSFTEFKGELYFLSNNELWKTNGTPTGDVQLYYSLTSGDLKIVGQTNDYLFFQDSNASAGLELYRTDGTPGGTILLKDINPGPGSGFDGSAAAVGNYLFFAGNNGVDGRELWKTDGSSGGTVMVEDINPGAASGIGGSILADNNLFYFVGTATDLDQPWVSDGTAEGTYQLQTIVPSPGMEHFIDYRIAHNGVVYFLVHLIDYDGGIELWSSSGTTTTTQRLQTVGWNPMPIYSFLTYQDKIYFWTHNEPMNHLWGSDGTPEGTQIVYNDQTGDGTIYYFDVVNNHLLFVGYGDAGRSTPLFRSDGTEAGTQRAYTFNAPQVPRDRIDPTTSDDLTFFANHDGPVDLEIGVPDNEADYLQLFQTDGFTTQSLRTMFGVSTMGAGNITDYNGKVIFTTHDDRAGATDTRKLLWLYDKDNPPASASFTLVNADTDEDIQTINNGDVLTLPEDLNINVRFNPEGTPQSVRFTNSGANLRTESEAPYSVAGDKSGDYNTWPIGTASVNLTAWPYYMINGERTLGTPVDVFFDIVRGPGGENCSATGTIFREYWDNVSGNNVSAIPVTATPNSTSRLTIFEGPTNSDTNYGARIRGYICPPVTGEYTFWIASNDHSELWLSSDDDPINKQKIAYVSGATNPREWNKFGTQKSQAINLIMGKRYYIEALHKQGVGSDNLAVGWQLPDGTLERPIPGHRLSHFLRSQTTMPVVKIVAPAEAETFTAPADILIQAEAYDGDDGTITKVEFFAGPDDFSMLRISTDTSEPYEYTWENVPAGNYSLLAVATDAEGSSSWSNIVHINIIAGDGCLASGTIAREYWSNVSGNRVSDIPLDRAPTSTNELTIFEGPSNIGTNYGTRIRGYICPPVSGGYNFYITSNDHSELWLSTDDDPANKVRIAYITGSTGPREWQNTGTALAPTTFLEAGKRYYIEALHKQGVGSDHIAVGWTLPDGTMERPIPGSRLSPFAMDAAMASSSGLQQTVFSQLSVYPNPAQSGDAQLSISGYEGIEQTIETKVEIINLTGEVIYADKVSCGGDCGSYLMNINKQLVPGIYLVNMNTNGFKTSKRLLVK